MIITELTECAEDPSNFISHRGGTLTEDEIWSLFAGVVAGVYHLHVNRSLHEDIKPSNVLISKGHVKLADLGKAVPGQSTSTSTAQNNGGDLAYRSPEKVTNQKHGKRADIWACGCVLVRIHSHIALSKPGTRSLTPFFACFVCFFSMSCAWASRPSW